MTRLKKLLVAGLMAIVTCCVSFGSAIVNVTNSIFSWAKASANSNDYSFTNEHSKATYVDGDVITVQGIPSETKKGESVTIPNTVVTTNIKTGEATTASQTRVLIKNPYGVDLIETGEDGNVTVVDTNQVEKDADTGNFVLTPSQVGVYTVQYAVKNTEGIWTVSDIYEINVTAEKYSLEFATNDPIVMPDKIDTNQGVDTKVNLKLPLVYDKNGEQITSFVLGDHSETFYYVAEYVNVAENGNVYFDGNTPEVYQANDANAQNKNVYEEYYTYRITKVDGEVDTEKYPNTLYVEVKVPGSNKTTNSVSETSDNLLTLNTTVFNGDSAYYTDAAYSFTAGAGKNIVTYKLCSSTIAGSYATPDAYVSYTIDGSISYDSSDIEIGVSTSSNVKSSSTSINKKCYLPKVSAVDKNANKNSVNAYYNYTVRYVDESGDKDKYVYSPEYVTMGVDEDGVYFIPHKQGTYNIFYNATDFYGNTDENAEDYDYDVNVTDRSAPSLYFVNSYDFVSDPEDKYGMKEEDVDLTDISYQIPTKYVINDSANEEEWTTIAVPAIFTRDNYKGFEELKISRTLSSENGFINTDGDVVKNYTIDIQDSNGATDFDAVDSAKKLNSTGVIYFENNEEATDYVVYNNKFYKKDGFSVTNKGQDDEEVTGTELTGTELKTALIKAKTSQVAYIKIDPNLFGAGEYTIEYSVQDGTWSNNSGKTFTFTLVKDTAENVDNTAPTVKFGTSTVGNVTKDQVITLDKPEIKDTDTRLLEKYYVVANNNYLELELDENDKLTFNTSDVMVEGATEAENKTIYDCAVESSTKDFKVVAMAFDDFSGYPDPKTVDLDAPANNIGVDYYTVSVKYVEDTLAPVIAVNGTVSGSEVTENNENKQYTEIAVHGVKFYDNTNTAKISVKVLNSKGVEVVYEELDGSSIAKLSSTLTTDNVKGVSEENLAKYVYEYNFAGVKFTATEADNYTVVYNIVDGGNNVVTYSYVIRATIDAQAPHITVLGTNATIELGETYYLKNISVSDNKTAEEDITFSAKVVGSTVGNRSSWFNAETMEFAPKAADTYTITLTAADAQNNTSTKSVVITVKDTIKPTLTLIGSTGDNIIVDEKENDKVGDIDWDNEVFPEITLPGFSVQDEYQGTQGFNGVIGAKGALTITTPSDKVYTIDVDGTIEGENPLKIERREAVEGTNTNYYYYFTPTERGHYVASYVAEDLSGNKSEAQVVNVYIGDTVKPDIYLTDDLKNTLTKGFTVNSNNQLVINPEARIKNATGYTSQDLYVGDNFGFKTKKVYTDDTNTEVKYEYVTVSVNVVNENNNTVNATENDDGLICYEFTKAGTYTITFTVTDSVGNIQTLTKTFKVSAETAASNDSTTVLGTVLIIVSIVILAGVIIYFVRGTKLLPKKNKKAKKQKEDKKD